MAKVKITKAEIIADLLRKAERDKICKLRLVDIDNDPLCLSTYHIRKVYPNPADAIRAAGLYPSNPNEIDLIRSLWKFYQEKEWLPLAIDAKDGCLVYDYGTYMSRFGNDWRKVLVAAKLLQDESNESWNAAIAKVLVQEIKKLYAEDDYLPTQEEHNSRNPIHDSQYIVRYIGGWEQLSKLTGLPLKSLSLRSVHSNATIRTNKAAP